MIIRRGLANSCKYGNVILTPFKENDNVCNKNLNGINYNDVFQKSLCSVLYSTDNDSVGNEQLCSSSFLPKNIDSFVIIKSNNNSNALFKYNNLSLKNRYDQKYGLNGINRYNYSKKNDNEDDKNNENDKKSEEENNKNKDNEEKINEESGIEEDKTKKNNNNEEQSIQEAKKEQKKQTLVVKAVDVAQKTTYGFFFVLGAAALGICSWALLTAFFDPGSDEKLYNKTMSKLEQSPIISNQMGQIQGVLYRRTKKHRIKALISSRFVIGEERRTKIVFPIIPRVVNEEEDQVYGTVYAEFLKRSPFRYDVDYIIVEFTNGDVVAIVKDNQIIDPNNKPQDPIQHYSTS
eukprot:TRINITY_DN16437_c0_g1_i1.p1 TRINITY_DN16437_c0_g1~~TRINITY_DN16437_c0_g1_i1.p1  ORF type:complete len:348 (+),score=116.29 TRINITY_DN16437_c0_g1_i1:41-1084(+)